MTTLTFEIKFHGWFTVGADLGRDGIDVAVDHDDPLPGDSLKGLMRATAVELVGDAALVGLTFGTPRSPSPWAWTSARGPWTFTTGNRIAIHDETGAARKDHLLLSEQVWAPEAHFTVSRTARLDGEAFAAQVNLLVASALAVHHVGTWRRRGLGWVGVHLLEPEGREPDVAALLSLREGLER